ncbi:MAG: hypothetical protein KAS62_04100, partial [Candidatus Delongbacteria bacterium]|nr:hypothetical protein [Candidatus Delongbacteria bacterium]
MKKFLIAFLLICFGVVFSQTATAPAIGDGSVGNPYQIANLENLYWVSADTLNFDKHYIQTTSIDAAETSTWFVGDHDEDSLTVDVSMGWVPIGNGPNNFTGNYNGQGHLIDNLFINRPTEDYIGLFGISRGEIARLGVSNAAIVGFDYVGALVGLYLNDMSMCYSSGSVNGNEYVGGLLGYSTDLVENCFSKCEVTGNISVGGLIGENWGHPHFCHSTGVVNSANAGGLIASGSNSIYGDTNFWDVETSGVNDSQNAIGLTTEEMKNIGNYLDAGWDFIGETANGSDDIWNINSENNDGYPYLSWQTFTNDSLPATLLINVTNSTTTSSTANCYVSNLGDFGITQHGVCWNTTGDPTIADYITEEGVAGSIGSFTSIMTGLEVNTNYYVRAYATDTDGTVYSNILNFISAPVDLVQPAGSGTEVNPYIISSIENLYWMCESKDSWDKYFNQSNNINAASTKNWNSGKGWKPIGDINDYFKGTYNGQGHIIDSLYINRPTEDYVGFFGKGENLGFGSETYILNLGLTNVNITGHDYVGGMCGHIHYTNITNSYTSGSVTGHDNVGGFVGTNADYIRNCFSTCNVSGNTYVGGFVGYHWSTSLYCYSTGSVTGVSVGGFCENGSGSAGTCFWDIETSGVDYSGLATGLTTLEMKTESTFTDAGWDFTSTWD